MTCWGYVRWNNDVAADDALALISRFAKVARFVLTLIWILNTTGRYGHPVLTDGACINPISKKAKRSGKGKQMIVNSKFIYMQTFSHKTKSATANTFCHSGTFVSSFNVKLAQCIEVYVVKVSPDAVLSAGQAFKVSTMTFQSAANDLQAICMMDAMPAFAMTAQMYHLHYT